MKVMDLYGAEPNVLEIEYFDEAGTGLGPTQEFYANVSKEFCQKKLKLWRDGEGENDNINDNKSRYVFSKFGLFPAPMDENMSKSENGKKIIGFFNILGKFIARSLLDSRIVDFNFSSLFFALAHRAILGNEIPIGLESIKLVDIGLYKNLKFLMEYVDEKRRLERNGTDINEDSDILINNTPLGQLSIPYTRY